MTKSQKLMVLETAIKHFGISAQVDVAIEEMAELTQTLIHDRRGRPANIAEEIADVIIMLQQLEMCYNIPHEKVRETIDTKIMRLAMKLEKEGALLIAKMEVHYDHPLL